MKDGGKVLGEVKFTGDVSPPEKLTVNKDVEGCGKHETLGEATQKVTVGANEDAKVSVTMAKK